MQCELISLACECKDPKSQKFFVQVGTPLCVPSREGIDIGKIASMEINHKVVDTAKKGQTVAMKVLLTFHYSQVEICNLGKIY